MQIVAAFMILLVAGMASIGMNRSTESFGQPINMGETAVDNGDLARANAIAGSLHLYHQAAVSYALANPGFTGPLDQTAIAAYLPSQYRPLAAWTAQVAPGRSVVTWGPIIASSYRGLSARRIVYALNRIAGYSVGTGLVAGNIIQTPHLRPTGSGATDFGAPIPAALVGTLPDGAPARVSNVD